MHWNPQKVLMMYLFSMIALSSSSVYLLSMHVCRQTHAPYFTLGIAAVCRLHIRGYKSDEWATSSVVSGGKRKMESLDIIYNNFSDGLKNRGRKIRQHTLKRSENIFLQFCPCPRQRMSHWSCPWERWRGGRSSKEDAEAGSWHTDRDEVAVE